MRPSCVGSVSVKRTGWPKSEMHTGLNGPRWFRSENIIPIEQARARRKNQNRTIQRR